MDGKIYSKTKQHNSGHGSHNIKITHNQECCSHSPYHPNNKISNGKSRRYCHSECKSQKYEDGYNRDYGSISKTFSGVDHFVMLYNRHPCKSSCYTWKAGQGYINCFLDCSYPGNKAIHLNHGEIRNHIDNKGLFIIRKDIRFSHKKPVHCFSGSFF